MSFQTPFSPWTGADLVLGSRFLPSVLLLWSLNWPPVNSYGIEKGMKIWSCFEPLSLSLIQGDISFWKAVLYPLVTPGSRNISQIRNLATWLLTAQCLLTVISYSVCSQPGMKTFMLKNKNNGKIHWFGKQSELKQWTTVHVFLYMYSSIRKLWEANLQGCLLNTWNNSHFPFKLATGSQVSNLLLQYLLVPLIYVLALMHLVDHLSWHFRCLLLHL